MSKSWSEWFSLCRRSIIMEANQSVPRDRSCELVVVLFLVFFVPQIQEEIVEVVQ